MYVFNSPRYCLLSFLSICVMFQGCGNTERKLDGQGSFGVDFGGSWEMDYGQSDNIQTSFEAMVRELWRQVERRNRDVIVSQGPVGGLVVGGGANSNGSIMGLAQMADLITRSSLLEIEQNARSIKVKREGTFALRCEFHPDQFLSLETPFGSESCGWRDHQLVFRIVLPDDLSIQHVMSLGPQGHRLNIATTVTSELVSTPFTLNRVFNRFVPGNRGYRCTQTISRGKVCTTESE